MTYDDCMAREVRDFEAECAKTVAQFERGEITFRPWDRGAPRGPRQQRQRCHPATGVRNAADSAELRRRITATGLTVSEWARQVHVSAHVVNNAVTGKRGCADLLALIRNAPPPTFAGLPPREECRRRLRATGLSQRAWARRHGFSYLRLRNIVSKNRPADELLAILRAEAHVTPARNVAGGA